jgi:SNF2 family DNA or RNA helicase
MGFGKTSTVLDALCTINLTEPGPALILAPLRVAQSVWPQEIKKFDCFNHLSCSAIVGDAAERLATFRAPADIYTLNFENLPWLIEECYKIKKWPFTKIVADEATRLKSFRLIGQRPNQTDEIKLVKKGGSHGQRARSLGKVAWHSKVTRFIELTGTPASNGLIDLWGQLWFLDRGQRLGRSRGAFLARWFTKRDTWAPWVPLPHAQKEIENAVKDICLSLRAEDWFDLDKTIFVDIPVTLPQKAMLLYKQFEKELFAEISGKEVEALSAASKSIKCLQLANGAIYTDELGNYEVVHDAKLDALDSVIEEAAGTPLLVVYNFKSDLARLKKRFPQGVVMDKSTVVIDKWNRGEVPLLFIHPQNASHGLNLQNGSNLMAIFGHDWNLEYYMQVIERIGVVRQYQSGHPRPVFVYNIRAVGTIDSVVIARRESKRSVQDSLLEAARQGVK